MPSISRAHLLVILLVTAMAVPRGVLLGWCLCAEPEAACCTTCCCEEGLPIADDCDSCKSIELEDFDELLTDGTPVLPDHGSVACLPRSFSPVRPWSRVGLAVLRGPPPLGPSGLVTGVIPQRL